MVLRLCQIENKQLLKRPSNYFENVSNFLHPISQSYYTSGMCDLGIQIGTQVCLFTIGSIRTSALICNTETDVRGGQRCAQHVFIIFA